MASAKRKQDEKNLKTLRELVSLPGNKECFDCRQRGPTYVNMTIGSFVCTSCSGMLRGLTPPHRVKSISMATFTQEEIEFVKERGNEHCRRIWLGLMNPSSPPLESKDEQKMKDLMSAKYELKRYYLDPSATNPSQKQQQQNGNQAQQRATQYTQSTLARPQQQKRENKPLANNNFQTDFVADFSKVPDPFGASPAQNRINQPIVPQPFFANFDNNPVFSNAAKSPATLTNNGAMNGSSSSQPPSEDRYAALKDLDSLMKQAQLKEDNGPTSLATAATWNANNSNATNPIWGGNGQTGQVISNPFVSGDLWRPATNNNNNNSPIDGSHCNSANPFKPVQFPVNNDNPWAQFAAPTNGDVIQFSQLMSSPLANKMWQPAVPAYHANPFMVGSGVSNMTRNSNNPFL